MALINVSLLINIIEGGIARSAVRSGWLLTAFTITMAATSYLGGVASGRAGYRRPIVVGMAVATVGFVLMGVGWEPTTGPVTMALHLALVGAGIGLVLTPTSTAVIDLATDDERGTAAGLVILSRLIGFSLDSSRSPPGVASVRRYASRRRARRIRPPNCHRSPSQQHRRPRRRRA